jgi:hypothetical protein
MLLRGQIDGWTFWRIRYGDVMMKSAILFLLAGIFLSYPADGQRKDRPSLLDSDPDVVYLDHFMDKPVSLNVVKQAPVFSDRNGKNRLGFLKADQIVKVEAITDKVYRVRGDGLNDGIAGWVAPWAFTSADPDFVKHLKGIYDRQIQVRKLIEEKQIAIGMSLSEVEQAIGKPTKTSVRKTDKGNSGTWEFIEYREIKHYTTRVDPLSGQAYRVLSHIEQVERERTNVEYEDNVVTAIEEKEDRRRRGAIQTVTPPLIWAW